MTNATFIGGVPQTVIDRFYQTEAEAYENRHPNSKSAMRDGQNAYFDGVPFHWMKDWSMPFPMVIDRAWDASIETCDGYILHDFCLGDTGSFFGHSPAPVAAAIREQANRGLTYMLPTQDAIDAAGALTRIFGAFQWQIATTATDANRNAIRVARAITGRSKILVFNGCYHGTVEDVMVELIDGKTQARSGLVGQLHDLTRSAVAVEFNDLAAVETALKSGDIAAILTEPVMTNCCMVLPDDGFMAGLRDLATQHGAVLIIDETHTFSAGPGGMTKRDNLEPDLVIIGKSIAGGIPTGTYGLSAEFAARVLERTDLYLIDMGGVGGTLAGNPLSVAAMRATLESVLTKENFADMIDLATYFTNGVNALFEKYQLPWSINQLGTRAEYRFAKPYPKTGTAAHDCADELLEDFLHLYLVNRGVLLTPFHNMVLMCPATTKADVDRHQEVFEAAISQLVSAS